MGYRHVIDPATGDNLLDATGALVRDSGPDPAIVLNMRVARGSWWANPDIGNRLAEIRLLDDEAVTRAEDAVHEALDYLVESGEIESLGVEAVAVEPGDAIKLRGRTWTATSSGLVVRVWFNEGEARRLAWEQFVRVG